MFRISEDEGRLAENLVFKELKKQGREVYYWKKKGEADFVVKHPDRSLSAINVSYTDALPVREEKALLACVNNVDLIQHGKDLCPPVRPFRRAVALP